MNNESSSQPAEIDQAPDVEHQSEAEATVPQRFESRKNPWDGVDHELINKTKTQIRNLVSEIAELAKSDCELKDFFEGFLIRTTSALASDGGAVWLDETGTSQFELQYHVNLDQTCLADDESAQKRHSLLLNKLRQSGEPSLIPPNSGSPGDNEPGNPTDRLLIVGPLKVNNQSVGLVEIFQRTGAGPTTQRGYLRFLTQMCEIASDYLKSRRIQNFGRQQALWQQLDSFVREIHRNLDTEQTAYVIANEGRRIIDCDRVSVVLVNGGRARIKAVSGLDSIERRADQIKHLQKLTNAVVRAGEPIWYTGDDEDLPPQIEKRLHAYVDKSHTKMLAILPLTSRPASPQNEVHRHQERTIGALIVEQLKDSVIEDSMRKRVDVVAAHSKAALANSVEHNSLFLMPLWKTLGRLTQPFAGTRLPKTLIISAVAVGIVAFFALFPYPFTLSANGNLQPQIQNEVFAGVDGILDEVLVSEDTSVMIRQGDILARMSNNDLMLQIQNLEGQIKQTEEQIRKFKRALTSERLEKIDDIMIDGEHAKSEEALKSLLRELAIKKQLASKLIVRSPADGFVTNWQVRQSLLKRPVDRGQNLMTVVDPNGGWQLELEVPERRMGHLLKRRASADEPVRVNFALVSHPGKEFAGELTRLDEKMEVYSEDGNCAKAIVRFDNSQIPQELLKSGTRINAKLHCGTRSIGFVWFHELFETVDMTWRYWF
jgi:hypothetical protein